jgi:hypothetical protein
MQGTFLTAGSASSDHAHRNASQSNRKSGMQLVGQQYMITVAVGSMTGLVGKFLPDAFQWK